LYKVLFDGGFMRAKLFLLFLGLAVVFAQPVVNVSAKARVVNPADGQINEVFPKTRAEVSVLSAEGIKPSIQVALPTAEPLRVTFDGTVARVLAWSVKQGTAIVLVPDLKPGTNAKVVISGSSGVVYAEGLVVVRALVPSIVAVQEPLAQQYPLVRDCGHDSVSWLEPDISAQLFSDAKGQDHICFVFQGAVTKSDIPFGASVLKPNVVVNGDTVVIKAQGAEFLGRLAVLDYGEGRQEIVVVLGPFVGAKPKVSPRAIQSVVWHDSVLFKK
jgi:hypothetical protein